MVLSCSSVCASRNLLTLYLAEYLTHFHQIYINDALWDRDERFTIWGPSSRSRTHGGIVCLFLGLLTRCLEKNYAWFPSSRNVRNVGNVGNVRTYRT